jgi:hypothetical protein
MLASTSSLLIGSQGQMPFLYFTTLPTKVNPLTASRIWDMMEL